jgi:hypothetical protein
MSDKRPEIREVGDEVAGFRIKYTPEENALHIECWGYWIADVAAVFGWDAVAACQEVSTPLDFVLDASALKPQGEQGQGALRALMSGLASLQLSSTKVFTGNILTKIQLTRLARECGVDKRLQFDSHPADASPSVAEA